MAKIRRVVRKVATAPRRIFRRAALAGLHRAGRARRLLDGRQRGVSAAVGRAVVCQTAWPSLIGIPLVVAASWSPSATSTTASSAARCSFRSCSAAILHVALVVQMVETRIFGDLFDRPPRADDGNCRAAADEDDSRISTHAARARGGPPAAGFRAAGRDANARADPRPEEIVRQERRRSPRSPPEPQPVPVPENVADDRAERRPPQPAERSRAAAGRGRQQAQPADQAVGAENQPARGYAECRRRHRPPAIEPGPVRRRSSGARRKRRRHPGRRPASRRRPTDAPTPQLARRTERPIRRRKRRPADAAAAGGAAGGDAAHASGGRRVAVAAAGDFADARRARQHDDVAADHDQPAGRAGHEPSRSPEITSDRGSSPQRRESPAEPQPSAVAATPSPVANRQPRATARPDVATTAATVAAEHRRG